MKRFITVFAASLVLTLVCAGVYASQKKESPAPAKEMPSAANSSVADTPLSGKVVETMNSGGYTYVRIEKKGKKSWIAIPETKVTVGKEMAFQPGQEMKGFTSKSLNRTFDSIIFSGGALVKTGAGKELAVAEQHDGSKTTVTAPSKGISVEKATGPDAYTVAEIYAKSASLNEKTAVVKAKVVKVSKAIMGKNWIHLQDGTGDAKKGTHNLVATSQDLPAVGDVVTMKGTVYKDKDFGYGYKYSVIMEKASIQR